MNQERHHHRPLRAWARRHKILAVITGAAAAYLVLYAVVIGAYAVMAVVAPRQVPESFRNP